MARQSKKTVKKVKRTVPMVKIYIISTFNNTLVSITDPQGNVIAWSSAGCIGYKGSRKSTPFVAQETMKDAFKKAYDYKIKTADVFVKGPGTGREYAIRAIQAVDVEVKTISDITPIVHNGCRPRKKRRN